jgi:hypothetical protein
MCLRLGWCSLLHRYSLANSIAVVWIPISFLRPPCFNAFLTVQAPLSGNNAGVDPQHLKQQRQLPGRFTSVYVKISRANVEQPVICLQKHSLGLLQPQTVDSIYSPTKRQLTA